MTPSTATDTPSHQVQKIMNAQTTGGYIVNKHYMETLRRAFADCNVIKGGYGVAIDTCWKKLQPAGNWYTLQPQLGMQISSMSDIQGYVVDYETMSGMHR